MPDKARIALDAMGGDHGASVVLPGADISLTRHPDIEFLLYGDRAVVEPVLNGLPRLKAHSKLVHTEVSIRMDDKPSQALRSGRHKSSMWLAIDAVKKGEADVVVSAGNSANRPYVVGSPSTGVGVISVAQTQTPSAKAVPLVVNTPASIAGIYGNTQTLDFAPIGAGVTGDVVYYGRGCPGDPVLASPADKIALIDRGVCAVSLKVDAAARAGARGVLIGLVASGDAIAFGYGGGTTFVPSLVIQQSLSSAIKAKLTAPGGVNVSMSNAAAIALVGSMASTSSRGPAISTQQIKPEIGAPGASISAEVGTGTTPQLTLPP